jgi:hypothetical protein
LTGLEDARTRERAELLARDIIEYLDSIDYNKYYDAMGQPGTRGGDKEKQFSEFSSRAVDAAQVRLTEQSFQFFAILYGGKKRHVLDVLVV